MNQTKTRTVQANELLQVWVASTTFAIAFCSCWLSCLLTANGQSKEEIQPANGSDLVQAAQEKRIDVMRRASAATIAIFGLDGGGGGSGVVVTPDGFALTNYHVSSACGDHMRCGMNDGHMYDAVIVGVDATGDVSLIKLLGRSDFPTAPLADSSHVRVGQWCFAAGNPFVLATNLQPSVSLGIVSGTGRYQYPAGTLLEYSDCIQTDAAINPGNSGGPLFDLNGEVIGINGRCSFEKRGRVNVGVGYAISANQIKNFWGVLASGRLVDHATLGATVATDDSGRVVVSNILSSSDAYRRGLRYDDEILSLVSRDVRTTNDFKNILGTLPRDWRIPLTYRRNGVTNTILVRLQGVHTEQQLADLVQNGLFDEAEQPPSDSEDQAEDLEQDPKDNEADLQELPNDLARAVPDAETVATQLESRPGFANYYFNAQNRERLWSEIQQQGDFSTLVGSWRLKGILIGETTAISAQIGSATTSIQIGSREVNVDLTDSLADLVAKGRESGLAVALKAWQQLLTTGPRKMGDVLYMGTMPAYLGNDRQFHPDQLFDVLQIAWYDARIRAYIRPGSGEIVLIEVFGDDGVDPVELYFDNYEESVHHGKTISCPKILRLQYGLEPMLLVQVQDLQFELENNSQPVISDAEDVQP
ncbi:MAG: trypsin-like peptidase domain-containing protein [Planctomycetales bacterium]|nr:trypsin-like peptidase domain-containing protein [Planctomycetales bacterium]